MTDKTEKKIGRWDDVLPYLEEMSNGTLEEDIFHKVVDWVNRDGSLAFLPNYKTGLQQIVHVLITQKPSVDAFFESEFKAGFGQGSRYKRKVAEQFQKSKPQELVESDDESTVKEKVVDKGKGKDDDVASVIEAAVKKAVSGLAELVMGMEDRLRSVEGKQKFGGAPVVEKIVKPSKTVS